MSKPSNWGELEYFSKRTYFQKRLFNWGRGGGESNLNNKKVTGVEKGLNFVN